MYILAVLISLVIWIAIDSRYKLEDNVRGLPIVFSLILIFAVPFVTMLIFGLVYLLLWLKANYFSLGTNQRIDTLLEELNIYDEFYNKK